MIKKLGVTGLDKKYLASRVYNVVPVNVDFNSRVVIKPWGHEYMFYNNPEMEIWSLFIKYQRSTSMHCHPNKKTALVVLEGRALFSSLNESCELDPLDAMVIDAGVFHSTQCVSGEGLRLLEFETPPMKHDLVRLEDKYGRVEQGYEGADKTMIDTERVRFSSADHGLVKKVSKNEICIKPVNSCADMTNVVRSQRGLAVILSGLVKSEIGETLYYPSNIIALDELSDSDLIFEGVFMLFIGRDA